MTVANSGSMNGRSKDGIRRRKTGWEFRWVDPDGRTKRRTFDTQVEAKDFRDGVRVKMKSGSYIDPNRAKQKVRTIAEKWFESVDARPTTRAAYKSMLKTYLYPDPLASMALNLVNRSTLLAFKNRLDDLHRA